MHSNTYINDPVSFVTDSPADLALAVLHRAAASLSQLLQSFFPSTLRK